MCHCVQVRVEDATVPFVIVIRVIIRTLILSTGVWSQWATLVAAFAGLRLC